MILSDYIETYSMNEYEKVRKCNAVKKSVLLPNAFFNGKLNGFVAKTDYVAIPSFLGDNVGRGLLVAKIAIDIESIKTNTEIIRNLLISRIRFGNGIGHIGYDDFVSIGDDKRGNVYVTVRSGANTVGKAIGLKYDRILRKAGDSIAGFKIGTKGYTEYLLDYKNVIESSKRHRKTTMDIVMSILSMFSVVDVIKEYEILSHTIDSVGDGLVYRNGACKVNNDVGIICGNINTGIYICGTRKTTELIDSYPSGLGRSIGMPKAKQLVDMQTLENNIGGVKAWMDEGLCKEAPFNFKSINTIKEDSCGAIFAITAVRNIINVRG